MSDSHPFTFAIIDPVGSKAGMDHYDMALTRGLAANGVKGIIFSNFNNGPEGGECVQIFHNTGKHKLYSAYGTLTGFVKALLSARQYKIEWIVVHVFTAGLADAGLLTLARTMGFRICGIVHDIESLDDFSPGSIRKRVIGKLLDVRIVHNRFSYNELVRLEHITNGDLHTHIIPHVHFRSLFEGNSESRRSREELAELSGSIHPAIKEAMMKKKPIFLFFGQIKKPKGLDLLLRAFREIRHESLLVIAGKPRDEPWQRYQTLIGELDLEGTVIPVIRHITDRERDLLFSVSRAVVLPYTRIYQSGVLLMAMSFPLAVIASDLHPNLDILVDGENGLLFASGDANDLSRQMKKMISNDELASRCSENALKTLHQKHDPATIGKAFAEILRPDK